MSPRFARAASVAGAITIGLLTACTDATTVVTPTPVASVEVSPPATSLIVGEQVTLRAKPKAQGGAELPDREVTWSTENAALATVSSTGVVTTLATGEVGIRATSEGRIGRAVLTIAPVPPVPVAEVRFSVDAEVVLAWDGQTQVTAAALDEDGNVLADRGDVTWSSSRPTVATVLNGTIEAEGPGITTITATIEGVSSQLGVRVLIAPITEITIEGQDGLEMFETAGYAGRVTRASGQSGYEPITWTSSNPEIMEVTYMDLWGATVQAKAVGEVTLTASRDGISDTLTMRVSPRVSHELIYNRWSGPASEIFVLPTAIDGYPPVRINAGNVSRDPSASPDGTQLVFAVSQVTPLGEQQHDLFIVNRDGMNMRWLTRAPGLEDRPRWSPDGSKILYRGMVDARADLYTITPDGNDIVNLTADVSTMTDVREASWSPDGSRVAFIGVSNGQHKVWTMRADGSDLRQVTTDAGFDMTPTYSPDGTKLAFARYNAAAPVYGNDIMIVAATGGVPTRLALKGDQLTPAWSPDGHYIAVSGTPVAGQGVVQIYTLRPDGTGLRLRTIDPAWGGGTNPTWIARQ
ncbi:MAG TPA: Ig-like domain-containing protein [Gemmatimonadaceae bacterium]|nr:Ig-like domain-containing protein [Gemmatimonadaceae bacterium]